MNRHQQQRLKSNINFHSSSRHAGRSFRTRARTVSEAPVQQSSSSGPLAHTCSFNATKRQKAAAKADADPNKEREEWLPLTVRLDVGGRVFRVRRVQLSRHPGTRLGRLAHLLTLLRVQSSLRGGGRDRRDHKQTQRNGARRVRHASPATKSMCSSASYSYLSPPTHSQSQTGFIHISGPEDEPKLSHNHSKSYNHKEPTINANIQVRTPDDKHQQQKANTTQIPNIVLNLNVNETVEAKGDERPENKSLKQRFKLEFEDVDVEEEIARVCDEFDLDAGHFYFDRNPNAFEPIADYYRTGALHLPAGVCFRAFQEELIYWGIMPVRRFSYGHSSPSDIVQSKRGSKD